MNVLAASATLSVAAVGATVSHSMPTVGSVAVEGVAAAGTVLAMIYGIKWKTAADVATRIVELEKERSAVLDAERERLLTRIDVATAELTRANKTIAYLEGLPNLQAVLELTTRTAERVRDRIDELHVENQRAAQRRHEELLARLADE